MERQTFPATLFTQYKEPSMRTFADFGHTYYPTWKKLAGKEVEYPLLQSVKVSIKKRKLLTDEV